MFMVKKYRGRNPQVELVFISMIILNILKPLKLSLSLKILFAYLCHLSIRNKVYRQDVCHNLLSTSHVGGYPGDEAELEHVVIIRSEGKLPLLGPFPKGEYAHSETRVDKE